MNVATTINSYESTMYPVPSLSFESINGFMTVSNAQLFNCDLNIVSKDSAPTMLKNVMVKCSSKRCLTNNKIDITTQRGSVEFFHVIADSIAIRAQQGRVKLVAVTQLNSETDVTVTTERGDMELNNLVASGNIQLESKQGNIILTIPMCGKYPAFMGSFQIAHANYQTKASSNANEGGIFQPTARVATDIEWNDRLSPKQLTTTEREKKSILIDTIGSTAGMLTGTIGCHLPITGSICPYSNELLITTESGKITITIDECQQVCGTEKPASCPK